MEGGHPGREGWLELSAHCLVPFHPCTTEDLALLITAVITLII